MNPRGKAFEKGQSGNPTGKARGTRHRATLLAEALLDGEVETIARKAIEMAKDGDTVAMRLVLERLLPPRRDRPISFALPAIDTASGVAQATSALLLATANGEITPGEAAELGKLLAAHIEAIKATDHEERLKAIEERANDAKS